MPDDAPEKKDGDAFDVVLLRGATDDGEGARVLRARPGRVEAGEVRPMREGRPLGGGEIVRLEQRKGAPALFDVRVEHELPGTTPATTPVHGGPAQVATPAYRDSWERTFGARPPRDHALN
ncbi:MAG TPA: hypothetical protein VIF09_14295 [Polyangiaceae bacterium]|jgi:hypothetical protein